MTAEARRRLAEVGSNEPARPPRTADLVQILLLLANPLVIILLVASAASAILGERVNASIIVLMVANCSAWAPHHLWRNRSGRHHRSPM